MSTVRPSFIPPNRPNLVLVVVGMGTLFGAMSGSMINLALPSMGREFGISIEDLRWVVQGYLLVLGVMMLPAGRLSDIIGHKRVYLSGLIVFGVMSVLCGAASSFALLVTARVFQALGATMLMASGPALLTTSFPSNQRGRVLGILSTATYTGLTVGPPLGGFVIAGLSWRWIFYFTAPICFALAFLGLSYLPKTLKGTSRSFDWVGAVALLVGLPLFLFALSEGRRFGIFDARIWGSLSFGALGLLAFWVIQIKRDVPLLDITLFKSRVFTGATLSAILNYVALFVMIILMPFYLEEGLKLSPGSVGLVLSVQPLVMAIVASPSGWLSDRIGSRGLATIGMLVLAAGMFSLSYVSEMGEVVYVVASLAVVGLGTGIFISPNSSALMGSAPRKQQGSAGSILGESRIIGMLFGVAGATFIFQSIGGKTGITWTENNYFAYKTALSFAAAVAILGAAAAAARGRPTATRKKQ